MAKTTSGNIVDVDIYGRSNYDGTAVEYIDSKAVSNALQMFVYSNRGDFLYAPTSGGVLQAQTFRTMTLESLTMLQFNIRNAITNNFSPNITLQGIDLTPDYDAHALQIDIRYTVSGSSTETTTVYVNADFHTVNYEYTDIEYTGENLLKFCQLKKTDMIGQYMELNPNTDIWVWGRMFKFINLTEEDEYFPDILMICNT